AELEGVEGILRARASALTRNVLVEFDNGRLDEHGVLARVRSLTGKKKRDTPRQSTLGDAQTSTRRARVAVRGLDRDPNLARRLVVRLRRRPEILRVSPSPLTGRVLVELVGGTDTMQEILEEIADLELPGTDAREKPAHPL